MSRELKRWRVSAACFASDLSASDIPEICLADPQYNILDEARDGEAILAV
jgi:hypothetical protein